MKAPNFTDLANDHAQEGFQSYSYAVFMHPNPYYYKYYWWVFWKGSPCDGYQFLDTEYRLSTKQAFDLRKKLTLERESFLLYNSRFPRLDPINTPFDPQAKIWQGTEWAKAFDEDTDEEYKGFK